MKDSIHLVYALDGNYVFPTMVSAASAAYLTKAKLIIHLFDCGMSDAQFEDARKRISNLNPTTEVVRYILDKERFKDFRAWKGSIATYSRMLTCQILKDVDWAIFFDGDTIWMRDIAELWNLREEKYLVQGSVDNRPEGEKGWLEANYITLNQYFCAGLMLMNLKRMREESIAQKCVDFVLAHPDVPTVDQTALNVVCNHSVKFLPPEWGVFSCGGELNNISVPYQIGALHYVSDLPWCRARKISMITDVVNCWWYFVRHVLHVNWPPCARMTRVELLCRRFCFKMFCWFPFIYDIQFVRHTFSSIIGSRIYRINPCMIYRSSK